MNCIKRYLKDIIGLAEVLELIYVYNVKVYSYKPVENT